MLKNDYEDQNCSIARALELVGERWTILVLRDVFLGRRRFDQIQQSLGVARNVLAARLDRLVGRGDPRKGPLPGAAAAPRIPADRPRGSTCGR